MNKFLLSAFLILAFCAYYGSTEDSLSSPEPLADAGTELEQRSAKKKSSEHGSHKKKLKKVRADDDANAPAAKEVAGVASKSKAGKNGLEKQGWGSSRVSSLPDLMLTAATNFSKAMACMVMGKYMEALSCFVEIGRGFMQYIGLM